MARCLEEAELINKVNSYIDPIKKEAYKDIYMLSHPVLNKNPYTSDFHQKLLMNEDDQKKGFIAKVKNLTLYYLKNSLYAVLFIFTAFLHSIFYRRHIKVNEKSVVIDSFLLLERVLKEGKYQELYFPNMETVLESKGYKVLFMPRLYGHHKQVLKMKKLFALLQQDKRDFLFEYAYLQISDYMKIFMFVLLYPFHHFSIWQQEASREDRYFNNALVDSVKNVTFESYARYLMGKRLAQKSDDIKVLSWCEFQNMEKNFYKAINESEKNISVYACEFLIQYKAYQSMFIDELDKALGIAPQRVLTNGSYYKNQANQVNGVSLRYKGIYEFDLSQRDAKNSIALLSYDVNESRSMLKKLEGLGSGLLVKIHPATDEKLFEDLMQSGWKFVTHTVYELFYQANVVFVAPMSGTALEAVASGIPVILVADEDVIIANPLCEVGKGKIWDIVFNKDKLMTRYNTILNYQIEHFEEALGLSQWYKDNFFIEPTEENIIKVFDLA